MDQKRCPKCGLAVTPEIKFCPECGTPLSGKPAPAAVASKEPGKSTAVRDTVIIVGALALVTAAYFLLKEQPEPPLQTPPASTEPARGESPTTPTDQVPHDMMTGMNAAILDSLPKDYNTLVLTGNNYMDHQQFPIAAECYRRALAISDESQDVRVDYGACLHGMGMPDRALEEFRKVLARNPKHPVANFNMGIVFSEQQKKDSTIFYMKKYLALDPNGQAAPAAKEFLKANGG
jgi:tetratricopeptide (TPR) repeat protein